MRADAYLALHGFADSRERAKKMIEEGRVFVNGAAVSKPSKDILDSDSVEIKSAERYEYVSRGGYKLEAALEYFGIDVDGLVCADLGASSGGFSDCLLSRGAKKIYAVDCGSGQLAKKIRDDERVVSIENTNARFIDSTLFGEQVDIAVMDLSFISQTLVFPAVSRILKDGGLLVSLISSGLSLAITPWGLRKLGSGKDKLVSDAVFAAAKAVSLSTLLFLTVLPEVFNLAVAGEYREALPVAYVVAASVIFSFLSSTLTLFMLHSEKIGLITLTSSLSALGCVIITVFSVNKLGYIGAAYSTVISYFMLFLLCLWASKRATGRTVINIKGFFGLMAVTLPFGALIFLLRGSLYARLILLVAIVLVALPEVSRAKKLIT